LVDDVDMTNNDAQETLPSLFGCPYFNRECLDI
jgi:hypothetical protein